MNVVFGIRRRKRKPEAQPELLPVPEHLRKIKMVRGKRFLGVTYGRHESY
jgi:hypothetical protein